MARWWLIGVLVFGVLAAPASARRPPHDLERGAIAERMGVPPRCAVIWISTVNRQWASFRSSPKPSCARWASNGVTVLHRSGARWHQAFAGSDIPCPVPHVPAAVAHDLKVGCPPR